MKKEPKYKQRCEKQRATYLEQIESVPKENRVYLDEMGAENTLRTLMGWSIIGKKSYAKCLGSRTERFNIVAAYRHGTHELIAPFEYSGATDSHLFTGWFEQILCPQLQSGDCVIMDNASFHHAPEIQEIAKSYDIQVIYLPAYSPDLNPIEKQWANFKRRLRKLINKCSKFQEAMTEAFVSTFSE